MFRRNVSLVGKPAFTRPSSLSNEALLLANISHDIYSDVPACYDLRDTNYATQCTQLGVVLTTACQGLPVATQDVSGIEYIKTLVDHLISGYYSDQPTWFCKRVKQYLELIYCLLNNPDIHHADKIHTMSELLPMLVKCGTGMHTHLNVAVAKLSSSATIANWLTELRTNIVRLQASRHIQTYNLPIGLEIHVYTAFMKHAARMNLQPAGGDDLLALNDTYVNNVNVTNQHLRAFVLDFNAAYHPSAMIDFLAAKLLGELNLCIAEKFIVNDGKINFIDNNYKDFFECMQVYRQFGTIDELFNFSENYTEACPKTHNQLCAVIFQKCFELQLFKGVTRQITHSGSTLMLIPSQPSVVVIDGQYAEAAAETICATDVLWPLIKPKLMTQIFSCYPVSEPLFDFLKTRYSSWRFKKINFHSTLNKAVLERNSAFVNKVLQVGVNLAEFNADNKTVIELAAFLGFWDIVILIAKHQSTDATDARRYGCALAYAVNAEMVEVVDALIKANTLANAVGWAIDTAGQSYLHTAIVKNNLPILELLLRGGAKHLPDGKDRTPIQYAYNLDKAEIIAMIAELSPTDHKDTKRFGDVLLRMVNLRNVDLARILLQGNAPFTWHVGVSKKYCLHIAVENKDFDMVNLLMEYQHNVTVATTEGVTPIASAAADGSWDLVLLMIANIKNDTNDSCELGRALYYAVRDSNEEMVKVLLEANASFTKWHEKKTKNSFLHMAVKNQSAAIVKLLLSAGANAVQLNANDLTPADYAVTLGYHAMADLFKNPQPDSVPDFGWGESTYVLSAMKK